MQKFAKDVYVVSDSSAVYIHNDTGRLLLF